MCDDRGKRGTVPVVPTVGTVDSFIYDSRACVDCGVAPAGPAAGTAASALSLTLTCTQDHTPLAYLTPVTRYKGKWHVPGKSHVATWPHESPCALPLPASSSPSPPARMTTKRPAARGRPPLRGANLAHARGSRASHPFPCGTRTAHAHGTRARHTRTTHAHDTRARRTKHRPRPAIPPPTPPLATGVKAARLARSSGTLPSAEQLRLGCTFPWAAFLRGRAAAAGEGRRGAKGWSPPPRGVQVV